MKGQRLVNQLIQSTVPHGNSRTKSPSSSLQGILAASTDDRSMNDSDDKLDLQALDNDLDGVAEDQILSRCMKWSKRARMTNEKSKLSACSENKETRTIENNEYEQQCSSKDVQQVTASIQAVTESREGTPKRSRKRINGPRATNTGNDNTSKPAPRKRRTINTKTDIISKVTADKIVSSAYVNSTEKKRKNVENKDKSAKQAVDNNIMETETPDKSQNVSLYIIYIHIHILILILIHSIHLYTRHN